MRTAPGALLLALIFMAGCSSPGDSSGGSSGEGAPHVTDSLTWLNEQILAAPLNPDGYAQRAQYHLRQGEVGAAMDDLALVVQADSPRM